jgi:hypothetical protein
MKTIYHACQGGLTAPEGYRTENCLVVLTQGANYSAGSKESCFSVKQCVSAHFKSTKLDYEIMLN